MCCGCCCGVLRSLKRYPEPASLVATPFIAALDTETCLACGVCLDRCQMDALELGEDHAILHLERCIGCGLCVTTCPTESLTLHRKPESEQPHVPKNVTQATIKLGRSRGKMGIVDLAGLVVKSQLDRLLAPRE